MPVQHIPDLFLDTSAPVPELLVYDFKLSHDVFRSKVKLGMHMFSFLQMGKKQLHFANSSVQLDSTQSVLVKKGNGLWTELLEADAPYSCKLLFFSERRLKDFLIKHQGHLTAGSSEIPYFQIGNDAFIGSYLRSLDAIPMGPPSMVENMLQLKFEEILLYLLNKYGADFNRFLHGLVGGDTSAFRDTVERCVHSHLKVVEIAFLCHMSLSTFKRHFIREFKESPGKWLQRKRLEMAKMELQEGRSKPSDLYLEYGYSHLSNFSSAFKHTFGKSPKEVMP